jgi:hypothetical protein
VRTIATVLAWLAIACASHAHDALREQAIELEEAGKWHEAVAIYQRAARAGDGKAARRLAEIYYHGVDGVPRNFEAALRFSSEAKRLGENAPVQRVPSGSRLPAAEPRPPGQSPLVPERFGFGLAFLPRGGSQGVTLRGDVLTFESTRLVQIASPAGTRSEMRPVESISVKPSLEQWRKFRESLDRARVWEWRRRYDEPMPDGTDWSMHLKYPDRVLRSGGSNGYPADFAAFKHAVNALLGSEKFK